MSILEEFRRDEQRVLDRLVDGELGQFERRQLMAALDDEPSAWRRCALAFLESQNFRWQLSRLKVDATLNGARSSGDVQTLPLARRGRFWGLCLAAAASLMVAFGLGTRFSRSPTSTLTTTAPLEQQAARTAPDEDEATGSDPVDLQKVTLALADGQEGDQIELPVAVASQDDAEWLNESESSLPERLLDQLRASGMEVVRRHRLFPLDLSDGRRLVVPVEQVDIRRNPLMEEL